MHVHLPNLFLLRLRSKGDVIQQKFYQTESRIDRLHTGTNKCSRFDRSKQLNDVSRIVKLCMLGCTCWLDKTVCCLSCRQAFACREPSACKTLQQLFTYFFFGCCGGELCDMTWMYTMYETICKSACLFLLVASVWLGSSCLTMIYSATLNSMLRSRTSWFMLTLQACQTSEYYIHL